ncbi:MAG: Ldh family oxidoreductase [Rhodospirillales bacterium]|nr:Ldh family oxidoreductase [Rhodospirillales bacterium]
MATLDFDTLADLLTRIFIRHGVAAEHAALLGRNCATCERDGAHSHGVFRIPGYVASLDAGWIDGQVRPVMEDCAPSFLRVDAANGFAQPALAAARPALLARVARNGVALLAIRRSHHFSALWPDLEPFADQGLVALSMVAGIAGVMPPGARKPVFGTNPIAFATPVAGARPLVFDLATSAMSNGDLRIAAREGRAIPPDSGVDRAGRMTTDPKAVLDGGGLLTFGGYKGASIALMVEILASALTGGQFSAEVDFSTHPGAETPCTGQVIILIDPACGAGAAFADRVATLIAMLREAGQERLPSDRRYANRARAERDGITLDDATHEALTRLAS